MRALRKARRLTQRALAGGELSESFISMLEHGKARPSLATLRLLADRLNVPLTTLLDPPDGAAEAEARLRQAEVLLRRHEYTPALEAFEASLGAAARLEHPSLQAEAHLGMGQALLALRQFDLAEPHLHEAEAFAGRQPGRLLARALNARGLLATRRRDFPGARDLLRQALHVVREAEPRDRELEARILGNLGRVYTDLGLPLQALECFEAARPALEAATDPAALGLLHFNMGVAYMEQRAFEEAAGHLGRAAELFRVQENLQLYAGVKRSLGILLLDTHRPADAEPLLQQSLAAAERLADDAGRAQSLTELARAALALHRPDEAEDLATEGLRLASRIEDPAEAGRAHLVLGAVARARRRLQVAESHFYRAVEIFGPREMPKELTQAWRDLGFAYLEGGREGEAARAFAQAFAAQGTVAEAAGR